MKPWGRWATLGLGLVALLVGQLAGLIVFSWWSGTGVRSVADLADDGVALVLMICVSTPVQVLLLVLMARQTGTSVRDYLGLKLPRKSDLVVGVIAVVIFIVVVNGISLLLGQDVVSKFQLKIYRTASSAGHIPWLWLTVVVVAPIGEETLFRGFLFRGWHRTPHDAWPVIIITASLWAFIHLQYDLYFIGQVLACGLMLGWFRWVTGSTILTILLHALINFEGLFETLLALHD
jgi:uncharacterized protein